jgi:hypothetical protein
MKDYSTISSDYGIKVTLPGYDIATATPEQCAVFSKYPSPKINVRTTPHHYGIVNITITTDYGPTGSKRILTIPHNLGYTPLVLGVYYDPAEAASWRAYGTMPYYWTTGWEKIGISADSTNAYIDLVNWYFGTGNSWIVGRTITVRYYIFSEDALT